MDTVRSTCFLISPYPGSETLLETLQQHRNIVSWSGIPAFEGWKRLQQVNDLVAVQVKNTRNLWDKKKGQEEINIDQCIWRRKPNPLGSWTKWQKTRLPSSKHQKLLILNDRFMLHVRSRRSLLVGSWQLLATDGHAENSSTLKMWISSTNVYLPTILAVNSLIIRRV